MLISGRIIPTIGELPTLCLLINALELSWHLWVCHFNWQIEDQGLVEVNLSAILDTFDVIGLQPDETLRPEEPLLSPLSSGRTAEGVEWFVRI